MNEMSWMVTASGSAQPRAVPCRPARKTRRAGRARQRGEVRLLPPGARAPPMTRCSTVSGGERERQGSRSVQDEPTTPGVGPRGPPPHQLAEVAADAGRVARAVRARRRRSGARQSRGGPRAPGRRRTPRSRRRAALPRVARAPGRDPRRVILPRATGSRQHGPHRGRQRRRGRPDRRGRPPPPSTSGSEPRLAATTGTPTVIASSTGRPNPSSKDGSTSIDAARYSASRRSSST